MMNIFNTLNFGWRALFPERQDIPYKLNFMATNRCNQKCITCNIWSESPDELALEEIDQFFSKSNGFSWIDVTGGEIVLRPDILEIFKIILTRCRRLALLHFATNGSLVEETVEMTREILAMGPPHLIVTVSLDGPPETHDRLRGMEGSWERAVETFSRLRKLAGCSVYFGMTLSAENEALYDLTLDTLSQRIPWICPSDMHVNIAHTSRHYYGNSGTDMYCKSRLSKEISHIRKRRKNRWRPMEFLESAYLGLAGEYLESGHSPLSCRALQASCFIHSSGKVYPCVSWDRPIGQLGESDFDLGRIFESPEFIGISGEITAETCPGCWTPCEAIPAILADYLPSLTRSRIQGKEAITQP